MTSPSAKSSPFPKPPENCDVCGNQLPSHLARIGATRHPQCRVGYQSQRVTPITPLARKLLQPSNAAPTSVEHFASLAWLDRTNKRPKTGMAIDVNHESVGCGFTKPLIGRIIGFCC